MQSKIFILLKQKHTAERIFLHKFVVNLNTSEKFILVVKWRFVTMDVVY